MNIIFKDDLDKEKISNSNKYIKWLDSLSKKININEINIVSAKFDFYNRLESLNTYIKYIENNEEKHDFFQISGGKMFLYVVIVEEETDQKYVLIEKKENIITNKKFNDILSFDIMGTVINSKVFSILNNYFESNIFEPKFNELTHLTTAQGNISFSDYSPSIFNYELILESKIIQKIFDTFNSNNELEICRLEDFINKANTIESKIAYFAYQDISINTLKSIFDKKQRMNTENDIKIMDIIKKSIANGNVISLYQPIIQNSSERVVRYESLIRIKNNDNEFLMPDKFLSVAIKNDLYTQLTSLVIDQAIKILSVNFFSIVINLNSIDLSSNKIKQKIYKLLEGNTNDTNSKIIFELNEDQEYLDFGAVITFIKRVKKYGAKIGIDDYGTSERGLNKMLDLQPDFIKFRKKLILNLRKDPLVMEEVKQLIHFSKSNNIQTIAPYIETEELFNMTRSIGIDFSQGFYFGKPQELHF